MKIVKSFMRSPPVTASLTDTVLSVAEKMITKNIGSIIIMDGVEGVGLITEKDIVESILKWYKDPTKITARDIMSTSLICIDENKSVQEALQLMRTKKIRRLAVTKNNKIEGIITERRLLLN